MPNLKTLEKKAGRMARGAMTPREYRQKCLAAIHPAEKFHALWHGETILEVRSDIPRNEVDRCSGRGFRDEMAMYPPGFEAVLSGRVRRGEWPRDEPPVTITVCATGENAQDPAGLECFFVYTETPAKHFPDWTPRPRADVEADMREIATRREAGEMIEISFWAFTQEGRGMARAMKGKCDANMHRLSP